MKFWETFSESARRVVYFAQEEARSAGWHEVMPIHFFMGMLYDKECHAARILKNSGAGFDRIASLLKDNMLKLDVPKNQEIDDVEMTLSQQSKKLFEISYRHYGNINLLRKKQFTTAHLLLGLMDIDILNGYGLNALDFNASHIREEAKKLKEQAETHFPQEKEER